MATESTPPNPFESPADPNFRDPEVLERHPTLRTVVILIGLPASGKSTFARKLLDEQPDRWRRINKDDLRAMSLGGQWTSKRENWIRAASEQLLRTALAKRHDIIVDNTHLTEVAQKAVHNVAKDVGCVRVVEIPFNVPVQEALDRNAKRTGTARVPDHVILGMAKKAGIHQGRELQGSVTIYPPPLPIDPLPYDPELPDAVLCDLDGALVHMGARSPFNASRCDELDTPNPAVVMTLAALHGTGKQVLFMSGREDQYRDPSERSIRKTLPFPLGPPPDREKPLEGMRVPEGEPFEPLRLWMRKTGDHRRDSVVKRELYMEHIRGKYNLLFVLDDRDQVVQEWRRLGIPCFQVAPGNF